ncbi:MAG: hypothetical protein GX546_04105, partial [Acholeplasmataceae bacterium]|nr:hypothetical protein [Acholeplasmataceae bacterium]
VVKTIKQIRYQYYLKKYAELVRFYHDEELSNDELKELVDKEYLHLVNDKYEISQLGIKKVNLIIGDQDD